ncbi:MAG TPA: YkuS family protein [Capillibacterium sp.]
MPKYRIAVEDGLSQIEAALRQEGYQVVDPEEAGANVDAVVVTGMDENLMGITDTLTSGVVIDASGLDADEVLAELERRLPKLEQD